MNIFNKIVNKFQSDKLLHAYISTILTCILYIPLNCLNGRFINIVTLCGLIVLVIGILKEVFDKSFKSGEASFYDILADLIGILIGIGIILYLNIK